MSEITRRDFIKKTSAGLIALSATPCSAKKEELPTRLLGKTGVEIPLLTFGGGSQFLKNEDGDWEPLLQRALDMGIKVFDTASSYQWGASLSSEERFGEILSPHRSRVIISTKFDSRDPDAAMREIERSLSRLKTDYIDILMIHSIEKSEDLDAFGARIYPMMMRLKEEGVAKTIGFSSMNSAEKSKDLMGRFEVDVCLLAINATTYGGFAQVALPTAKEQNIGVLAMKVMRDVVGKEATPADLIDYALGQDGVASACIGHFGLATLEENARIIKSSPEVGKTHQDFHEIETRLAHLATPRHLRWARDEYYDGKMC
ncbi:aldo/keto reductase [candidate division KSB1 bacterium]|nr:aldo/keto reductase [candidate division KSB1 bacterium]RQW10448.1 MAG: aldo/keto reductase [candidate division KSB1 bacterium]